MKKIQTVILLCLLLASLCACESRQLNQQDPQPVVGESVESVQPEEPEENQWKVCGEIVDRVVKIAIRLLKNSYSQCMKENIVTLLEYLRFELDTINENQ